MIHPTSISGTMLLFDIDGTLLHCKGAGMRALLAAAAERGGFAHSQPPGTRIVPDGMTDLLLTALAIRAVCGREPAGRAEIEAVLDAYPRLLEEELARSDDVMVLPGVRPLLARLASDHRFLLGLGTGNIEVAARLKLARGGLNHYFSFGGFGSDSEKRVEILARARRRGEEAAGHPMPAESVVVIGDTERDVRAARDNGFAVVAVATGSTPIDTLHQAGAHEVLEDLARLEESLAALSRWLVVRT